MLKKSWMAVFLFTALLADKALALSPPWIIAWQELANTIGQAPAVKVLEPVAKDGRYHIVIQAPGEQASALRSILKEELNPYVVIKVADEQLATIDKQQDIQLSVSELEAQTLTALNDNPLFVKTAIESGFLPKAFAIIKPVVIQYYADDLSSYGRIHTVVAADIFNKYLDESVGEIPLRASSDILPQ